MELEKYSLGIGDRFGLEGSAQLRALQQAGENGVRIVPVWNKSNREHSIIGTLPDDTRRAADEAVRRCGWTDAYYCDADHIGLATVDRFLTPCNFFTIDVADFIGRRTDGEAITQFLQSMRPFKGTLTIPRMEEPVQVTDALLDGVAAKYLYAVAEAGRVYRYIAERKGAGNFVPEVSLDEASAPQTPAELLLILAALGREGVPVQTIAPKFTGSFLKGIDYVGNIEKFRKEFYDDLAVIAYAVETFNLPRNLKLSIHSGSDKFSLYPVMREALREHSAGLHLKTAGTTWLEEVIGLAASGGDGLALVKEIYAEAFTRYDELCGPYVSVIDIDPHRLPPPAEVADWSAQQFVEALRHDQGCPALNLHFRQFVHVSFRVAAEKREHYLAMLQTCRPLIESNVTLNIYDRHVRPLFL